MMDSTDVFIEHGMELNYITIITGAICVLGAFLMWKLNKIGFYLYTFSSIVFIIAPIYIVGNNMVALATTIIYGVFGLLFVILYGVNLKHMK
jgi:hypothetical protein